MSERDAAAVLEVARTADRCTTAVRAAEPARFAALLRESPYRGELLEIWARLLVTVVPEDSAAGMVERLWRGDNSEWLIGIEYFLDYAQRRSPATLARFVGEVLSWPWPEQSEFSLALLTTIAEALPDGILPSHYLIARGLVIDAAETAGCPGLTGPLTGLLALGWRDVGFSALRLAFDLARHVSRELPGEHSRRCAVAVLAALLGEVRAGDERVVVSLRRGARLLSDADDPQLEVDEVERATVVATRVVRFAGIGDFARLRAELDEQAREEHELVAVLLALALAASSHVREQAQPCLP
ncbi:hypothetical protein [Amycolatopsis sp.]|uniref:hypothetical protein n=1 Tax=Amycolatopsis sp. TaxID=37632 RepID=UPI002D0326EA|nr:hypothetical protein [Amycolatopsis sp.]HVV07905.1 hypothetical protein [Amycolatopsis sp.]